MVSEVMTEDPVTLDADETLEVARAAMIACRMRHLPITSSGELCGIVSVRDLAGVAPDRRAREVMQAPVETMAPEASIRLAAELLVSRRFSSLPLVRRGVVVGIVTSTDLVRFFCETLREETISLLMTPSPLTTIQSHQLVGTARTQMKDAHIRHLPVMAGESLVGFVSDVDLLPAADEQTVGEAMPPRFPTIDLDARAAVAGRLMIRDRLDALPIVHLGRLVGIVSAFDFLRHLLADE